MVTVVTIKSFDAGAQLRQVLRATQAGDSPEDRVQRTDHSNEGVAKGQVPQLGVASPAGAG